jgi:hypothetical protein
MNSKISKINHLDLIIISIKTPVLEGGHSSHLVRRAKKSYLKGKFKSIQIRPIIR